MKQLVAKTVELLPGPLALDILDGMRWLRYSKVRREYRGHHRVYRALGSPRTVMQGPFKGMQYLKRAYFGVLLPKVLGTYEMELWPVIEAICAMQSDCIVDLGAAEGYYAVGMAMRNPQAKVIAFELYKPVWSLIRKLATLNGLAEDRIRIFGMATPELLESSLRGTSRPVIVCDIEGGEDDCLDPTKTPGLKNATMLVEMHEAPRPGVTRRICERFAATHKIEQYRLRPRTSADLPAGVELNPSDLEWATDERRKEMEWLFLRPLS